MAATTSSLGQLVNPWKKEPLSFDENYFMRESKNAAIASGVIALLGTVGIYFLSHSLSIWYSAGTLAAATGAFCVAYYFHATHQNTDKGNARALALAAFVAACGIELILTNQLLGSCLSSVTLIGAGLAVFAVPFVIQKAVEIREREHFRQEQESKWERNTR